jgi:hypothetical protein
VAPDLRAPTSTIADRLVVAAYGLHSLLRKASGLEAAPGARRRFALRQHYEVRPWTDFVEVYVDAKGEAVATPVSDRCVGVNFVWEDGVIERPTIAALAGRFPALRARLGNAPTTSSVKGAGPMAQRAKRRNSERMVLVGDAAGFVDSISGDGLSIAFNSALILGRYLGRILARGATRESMQQYEREARRLYRGYWFVTNGLLTIARHPRARRMIINSLMRASGSFPRDDGRRDAHDGVRGLRTAVSASMRGLRRPFQQDLFLVFADTRRMVERGVISGRHRSGADRLLDALQLGRSFFGIVALPVGEIENPPSEIGGEISRRNGGVPGSTSSARMALKAGALENRIDLGIRANGFGGNRRRSGRLLRTRASS